ncbi:MAG: YfhO family protein, partial [Desulfamplus sp.]|nr:YfhO family protein [Desulfamplus sp.]
MEIPVRFLIISVFVLLIISSIYLLGREKTVLADSSCFSPLASCLIAITAYWAMAMLFFWQALIYDFVLLPGDILCWMYPWKIACMPDTVPHNPLLGDALSNYYPWMSSLKKGMENGYVPLWNFHSYSGSPLVANFASALFNPLNIFLYVMTVADFTTLMPFLRIVFVATGTFLFLRDLKFSGMPCFIGGTLFSFAGFQIVWLSNYPNITVIMYLPWLMLSMHRIASDRSIVWLFILILLSVCQFLGGHPESSFHMYLLVVPYFFYQLYLNWIAGTSAVSIYRRTLILVGAGILSIGCVAFQLIPFMEYLPYTTRYFEIIEQKNNIFGTFKFTDLLKLVLGTIINPDFFGNPVHDNYWTFANYNEQNTFFSVTGLVLACTAILYRFKKRDQTSSTVHKYGKSFFIIAAVLSFSMIVRVPFFYDFATKLPLFSMAANYRLIFVFVFCMTVLATAGSQAICNISTH